jgi:hypothetical protein
VGCDVQVLLAVSAMIEYCSLKMLRACHRKVSADECKMPFRGPLVRLYGIESSKTGRKNLCLEA